MEQAHQVLGAPYSLGMRSGINLPAFLIAMLVTVILAIGIQESAKFNSAIVVVKVAVVPIRPWTWRSLRASGNWGTNWHTFAPFGFSGVWQGAAYIFFAYIGFDAVSTTAQEAKNPQRDLPIGLMASLLMCTVLTSAWPLC